MENTSAGGGGHLSGESFGRAEAVSSGSFLSDFLSTATTTDESASFSTTEGDSLSHSTFVSDHKCIDLEEELELAAKFNDFHAPFSSHLGLISTNLERRDFRRNSSSGPLSSKSWMENGSAKTLPSRLDEYSLSKKSSSVGAKVGRAALNGFSKDSLKVKRHSSPIENGKILNVSKSVDFDDDIDLQTIEGESTEQRLSRLEKALKKAKEVIIVKEQRCAYLTKLQSVVDSEVQDLTEKLFTEAYKMVGAAEERRDRAERLLVEARLKVDLLQAEVGALKGAVKAATPKRSSKTNISRFLNNSLGNKSTTASDSAPTTPSPTKKTSNFFSSSPKSSAKVATPVSKPSNVNEIDPIYYREFAHWRENALGFDEHSSFFSRILREDVRPCLVFENEELSVRVLYAIQVNALEMEPISKESGVTARDCTLLKVKKACPYRLKTSPESEWQSISLLARNRIAAVCDFFTYIRYLHQGIIKPSMNDSYWNIVNLRKNMTLAKLGLHFVLKMNGSSAADTSPGD